MLSFLNRACIVASKGKTMIKQNDILIYKENLEKGDEYLLMIAVEDECTPSEVPMVKVMELNTYEVLTATTFFEAKNYKVVGHLQDGESKESLVKKYLPEDKWLFTKELFEKNHK